MVKFPQDTYDAVEKLYGNVICQQFPNYGKFWELFIGRNVSTKSPQWYLFRFPSSITSAERKRIMKWREELSMAHYSLFCNLAGAHFQAEELRKSLLECKTQETFFKHWEHFECFYIHIGNCFYQTFHLWDILPKFADQKLALPRFQKQKGLIGISQTRFKILRDNMVHYARIAHRQMENAYYIPRLIRKGSTEKGSMELWSQQLKRKRWQRTDSRLKFDLQLTERALNRIHGKFIREFEKILSSRRITVGRSQ